MEKKSKDYTAFLLVIWTMLMMLYVNQCHHYDTVERDLRDIQHEVFMLRQYK